MRKLNLAKVIDKKGLDKKEVAKLLFPQNGYPDMAIARVLSGRALLDSEQISRLALFVGIPISALFEGGEWKATSKGKNHIFKCDEYTAYYNVEASTTRIFHKGSMFHSEVIHSKAIPLNGLMDYIDKQILNYENS